MAKSSIIHTLLLETLTNCINSWLNNYIKCIQNTYKLLRNIVEIFILNRVDKLLKNCNFRQDTGDNMKTILGWLGNLLKL